MHRPDTQRADTPAQARPTPPAVARPGARPVSRGATVLPAQPPAWVRAAGAPGLSGVAAGAIDATTGSGLRTTFAIFFVTGCALVAALGRAQDRLAILVMPPLVYAAGSVVFGGDDTGATRPSLWNHLLAVVSTLITGAPVLLLATGVVVLVTLVRGTSRRY